MSCTSDFRSFIFKFPSVHGHTFLLAEEEEEEEEEDEEEDEDEEELDEELWVACTAFVSKCRTKFIATSPLHEHPEQL